MKKLLINIVVVTTALFATMTYANNLKIGVVDVQKVLAASPQAQSADASFKKEFAPREEKIKAAAAALQKSADDFQRNASVMSDKQKQDAEDKLNNERDKIQQDQAQFSQDVQTAQSKMMQAIFAKIKVAIAKVAKKGNYDMILQATAATYFKNKYDVTDQVISALK
jgi:outer membrane protein